MYTMNEFIAAVVGFACSHLNNLILFCTPRPIEARKDSNFFFLHIYLRSFSTTMHSDPDVLLFAPWIPSTFLEHPTSWPQRRVQGAYHSNKFEEDEASQGRIQFEGCMTEGRHHTALFQKHFKKV
jgi:hypothetical protein